MSALDDYWNTFIKATGRNPEDKCAGDLSFDAKGIVGDELVSLVVSERKTAFFTSFPTYQIDNEPLPVSGELYIVVDRDNNPRCIIEIDSVNIIPFCDVNWAMAQKEGEDNNLEEWRAKKQDYLEEEGDILGFTFTPDVKLVFQVFHVVYK